MKLSRALRLPCLPRLAAVGAGGKTSLLFQVGREILTESTEAPRSVLITTTTHLAGWQTSQADQRVMIEDLEQLEYWEREIPAGLVVIAGPEVAEQRLSGLNEAMLAELLRIVDENHFPMLIEADGARLKPLKAPGEHEPVIPSFTQQVVVCASMQGIGKPLSDEWVHRVQRFSKLSELEIGEDITSEALQRVLAHPEGGIKHIPAGARRILLLNQANTPELQAKASTIADYLQSSFDSIVISRGEPVITEKGSMINIEPLSVHEPVGGIILAAGGATRFGSVKQLLDWHGEPFVRQVAKTALQAGLSPLRVVVGAHASEVSKAVEDLPVEVVLNSDWEQGQASSVVVGVETLPENLGACVFMLCDQPQIPTRLVRSLVEAHQQSLAAIVAPMVDGRRGNPVLFDRETFGELAQLQHDQGGRYLFSRHKVEWVPWHDPFVLLDVDTEEDYGNLIAGP